MVTILKIWCRKSFIRIQFSQTISLDHFSDQFVSTWPNPIPRNSLTFFGFLVKWQNPRNPKLFPVLGCNFTILARTLSVQLLRYAFGTAPRRHFVFTLSRTLLTEQRLLICPTTFVNNFLAFLLVVLIGL